MIILISDIPATPWREPNRLPEIARPSVTEPRVLQAVVGQECTKLRANQTSNFKEATKLRRHGEQRKLKTFGSCVAVQGAHFDVTQSYTCTAGRLARQEVPSEDSTSAEALQPAVIQTYNTMWYNKKKKKKPRKKTGEEKVTSISDP